jgi:hypothetical protein
MARPLGCVAVVALRRQLADRGISTALDLSRRRSRTAGFATEVVPFSRIGSADPSTTSSRTRSTRPYMSAR